MQQVAMINKNDVFMDPVQMAIQKLVGIGYGDFYLSLKHDDNDDFALLKNQNDLLTFIKEFIFDEQKAQNKEMGLIEESFYVDSLLSFFHKEDSEGFIGERKGNLMLISQGCYNDNLDNLHYFSFQFSCILIHESEFKKSLDLKNL